MVPNSIKDHVFSIVPNSIKDQVFSCPIYFIPDQVGAIRQHLADIYEREQNWRQAASVLVGIPLETGQKQYSVDYKLETYLKIARLYLEDEDPVQGEAYINRAAQLQTQTKNQTLIVSWFLKVATTLVDLLFNELMSHLSDAKQMDCQPILLTHELIL